MLRPTIAPVIEPVTLAEARLQCQCDPSDTSEDVLITSYIKASRQLCEHMAGRRLITQTWTETLDAWPSADGGAIVLPETPVLSVASVTYVDGAGVTRTVAQADYRLDLRADKARLRPAFGKTWPTADTRADYGVVSVDYVVGFGSATTDVPEALRAYILVHVAAMFEQRPAVSEVGNNIAPLPYVAHLLDGFLVYE
jgi:uncharacterized phiE125 gp8 family phage protein